ncbi:hypothetical protein D3C84_773600 [compost metagenome]
MIRKMVLGIPPTLLPLSGWLLRQFAPSFPRGCTPVSGYLCGLVRSAGHTDWAGNNWHPSATRSTTIWPRHLIAAHPTGLVPPSHGFSG